MPSTTHKRSSRRSLTGIAAVLTLAILASGCYNTTWGIRDSFRNYVTMPAFGGHLEVSEGAVWLDGPGTGKGPFSFKTVSSTFDPATTTGEAQFKGKVTAQSHYDAGLGGYILDMTLSDLRLEIDGDVGRLYTDIDYRPFQGTSPATLPPLTHAEDVVFADIDLSGVDWTPVNQQYVVQDAPAVGRASTMNLIGWNLLYGTSTPELSAFSTKIDVPLAQQTPTIVASKTTDLHEGDTVTIVGSGFDPSANIGAYPPLPGQPTGVYLVFGKFQDNWRPSQGAPSANRTQIATRWVLPEPSFTTMNPTGTNPQYVELHANGTFVATITVSELEGTGNYGFYTYGAGGATNAAHELAVPASFG